MNIVAKILILGSDERGYGWFANVRDLEGFGGELPDDSRNQTMSLWNAIESIKRVCYDYRYSDKFVKVVSVDGKSIATIPLTNYDTYEDLPWEEVTEASPESVSV